MLMKAAIAFTLLAAFAYFFGVAELTGVSMEITMVFVWVFVALGVACAAAHYYVTSRPRGTGP